MRGRAALLLLLLAPRAAPGEVIDRIVAVVNDEIVTLSELEDATTPLRRQIEAIPDPVQRQQQLDRLLRQALDELIGVRLILQEATKRKVSVRREDIDAYIEQIKRRQQWDERQLELYLSGQGLTPATFRDQIREQLIQRRVVLGVLNSRINVSDGDVQDYYKEKTQAARTAHSIEAAHILLQIPEVASAADQAALRQQARELFARAAAGEDFAELARRYSDGPTAKKGGYLGSFQRGTLDPAFEKIAFELPVGGIGGPVRTRFGWHIVKVLSRQTLATQPFEEIKTSLKAELRNKRLNAERQSWIDALKKKAFIDVRL